MGIFLLFRLLKSRIICEKSSCLSTSLSILMIDRLLSRSCSILFLSSFFIRFSFEKDLPALQFDTNKDKYIRRAISMLGNVCVKFRAGGFRHLLL